MLKKIFYTVLALGAMITIGSVTSGFMSATTTTESSVEAENLLTGTWIAGVVNADGTTRDEGTGGWTIQKMGAGVYFISLNSKTPSAVAITPLQEYQRGPARAVLVTYSDELPNGYFVDIFDKQTAVGEDTVFSFMMYAK